MIGAHFDHADRLTSLTYSFQGSNADAPAYQWAYDNAGRVTDFYSWLDSSGTPTYGNVATWAHAQYNYDHSDQLATSGTTPAVTYTQWTNAPSNENYSYDANGNRTGGNYDTGHGNQMWEDAAGNQYWYDNEGNRILKLAPDNSSVVYTYDNRNRLTSVTYKDDQGNITETVNYTYDVFNRLVGKTISDENGESEIDSREAYVYDGENMILEFQNSTGNALTNADLVRRFLDGPAVDQVFAEEVTAGSTPSRRGGCWPTTKARSATWPLMPPA